MPLTQNQRFNVKRFKQHLIVQSSDIEGLIDQMVHDYWHATLSSGERQRQLRGEQYLQFKAVFRIIIYNLYAAWKVHPDKGIRLSLRRIDYSPRLKQYHNKDISYSYIKTILDYLAQNARRYIDLIIGEQGADGFQTRAFPTDELKTFFEAHSHSPREVIRESNSAPVIFLKGREPYERKVEMNGVWTTRNAYLKPLIPYVPTTLTRLMTRNLNQINHAIHESKLALALPDANLNQLNQLLLGQTITEDDEQEDIDVEAQNKNKEYLDLSEKCLYRVFNNGNWNNGGRFYGGWWQRIPKNKLLPNNPTPARYRKFITINGRPTLEADYSGLHVVMAYRRAGLTYDQTLKENEDAYFDPTWFPSQPNAREQYREIFKRAWQRMLNASRANPPEEAWAGLPEGWTLRMVEDKLMEKHSALEGRSVFYSGAGIEFQYDDSRVAEAIMLRLLKEGIIALPVHDSFIVQQEHQHQLIQAMREEYKGVLDVDYAPEKDVFSHSLTTEEWTMFERLQREHPEEYKSYLLFN